MDYDDEILYHIEDQRYELARNLGMCYDRTFPVLCCNPGETHKAYNHLIFVVPFRTHSFLCRYIPNKLFEIEERDECYSEIRARFWKDDTRNSEISQDSSTQGDIPLDYGAYWRVLRFHYIIIGFHTVRDS